MMPGALTSTRLRWSVTIGPLPSIGLPRPSTTRPQQPLADGHVDDGAGALDGVAFLDLRIRAEDDDADIVSFQVERHALNAIGKRDHLTGLDVVEAMDARNAVADRQHLPGFADFGLGAKGRNLILDNA